MRRILLVMSVAALMATAATMPAMAATNQNDTRFDRQLDQQPYYPSLLSPPGLINALGTYNNFGSYNHILYNNSLQDEGELLTPHPFFEAMTAGSAHARHRRTAQARGCWEDA